MVFASADEKLFEQASLLLLLSGRALAVSEAVEDLLRFVRKHHVVSRRAVVKVGKTFSSGKVVEGGRTRASGANVENLGGLGPDRGTHVASGRMVSVADAPR